MIRTLTMMGCLGMAVISAGCVGKVIDLKVRNETAAPVTVEVDGWGVYNEVIGQPSPGQVATYQLRVPACRWPTDYTIEAGGKVGTYTVSVSSPEAVMFVIGDNGIIEEKTD